MDRYPLEYLQDVTARIFSARGTPHEDAELVARLLVLANARGLHSHGILRVPQYVKNIDEGQIQPGASLEAVTETNTTSLLDVNWNFGQLGAHRAATIAMEKAQQHGLGCVGVHRCVHVGCLGLITERIAREGMVGLAMCSSAAPSGHWVAPWGGREGRVATNPISFAAPTSGDPMLIDFSTSTVSEGKARYARDCGEKLPHNWLVGADGQETDDPNVLYGDPGGAILPLGGPLGYKGFGLALMATTLAAILPRASHQRMERESNNLWLLAVDIGAFMTPDEFRQDLEDYISYTRKSEVAQGFDRVIIPGDLEFAQEQMSRDEGIPIPDEIWSQITDVAQSLNVSLN
jgi:LDH2 family malate/lactate/ureidoglycolate dehydrogenase